ncbi:MAG: M1 family metallopeptidase [Bacteroidia bacterium]|nr:M1 family metallopeptidase [Bacteroidia bacterium]
MSNKLFLSILLGLSLSFGACKGSKKETDASAVKEVPNHVSVTMLNDLQHTKLELVPDFEKKELKGTATILLKPHFYPVDSLLLNAKFMRIESVDLMKLPMLSKDTYKSDLINLDYTYDSSILRIKLDKRYTRDETYTVVIKYVAMPERAGGKGSRAITDSKGIYFIGPDDKNPDKPVQVWTQGETQSASSWFPTIEAPNQKSTQELSVSVPKKFKTISNGYLKGSSEYVTGNDTMRTDHWVQDKPHAPYLFALAIGEFAEVKDYWRKMPVNYYVEPAYEQYARMVFGNTPEMIEFFSTILKTDYPWDKYDQVVVRDFVSGAMENTSCVIHYDKLQHNFREHQDNTSEDVIAHELFHHWFGDLVTCESWSNLPLNESFATYGEYLWDEHKYGRDEADATLQHFRDAYYNEAEYSPKRLIRYDYEAQEDMFDAHSYQKGGLVLHTLRKQLGDEAFFESLRLYLERYKFKTAELSDLRLCFEEVTGQDLNWFFNQWFLQEGHPNLEVNQQRLGDKYIIKVKQIGTPYRMPFKVKIGKNRVEEIQVDKDSQRFVFNNVNATDMVVLDGENQYLGEIFIDKSVDEWNMQFEQADLAFHKIEAFEALMYMKNLSSGTIAKYCQTMLNHSFHECRSIALSRLYDADITVADIEPMRPVIIKLAKEDSTSTVRYETLDVLALLKEEKVVESLIYDSSYNVAKKAMMTLGSLNRKTAFNFANLHRDSKDLFMREIAYLGIGLYSDNSELDFFMSRIRHSNRKEATQAAYGLNRYVTQNRTELLPIVMDSLGQMYRTANTKLVRGNVMTALKSIRFHYYVEMYMAEYYIKNYRSLKKKYKMVYKNAQSKYNMLDKYIENLKGE